MIRISSVETEVSCYDISKDSELIVVCSGQIAKIMEIKNMVTIREITVDDEISQVAFSHDSKKLLLVNKKKTTLWARAVYDPSFQVIIRDLELKIINAVWVPDSMQIMTFSDLGIKATIYNLAESKQMILKDPKKPDGAFAFSNNKKFLAIAEKRSAKEFIETKYFEVETVDMADLHWSPDDSYLIVHESGFSYKLLVYLPTKQLLFSDDKQDVLGIKKIAFSPDTMYLATLTCDNKIIIYNSVSWTEVIKIDPKTVEEDENTRYYKEVDDTENQKNRQLPIQNPKKFLRTKGAEVRKESLEQPKNDRSALEWSQFSEYLAFKVSTYPNTLFVLELQSLKVHSIIQTSKNVKDISFKGNMLHFVWGGPNFGIWEQNNVGVANPFFGSKIFQAKKIEWSQNARAMVIRSTQELCIYYPNELLLNDLLPQKPLAAQKHSFNDTLESLQKPFELADDQRQMSMTNFNQRLEDTFNEDRLSQDYSLVDRKSMSGMLRDEASGLDHQKYHRLTHESGISKIDNELPSQRNTSSLLAHRDHRVLNEGLNLEMANSRLAERDRDGDAGVLSSNRNGLKYKIDTDNLIREYDLQRLSEAKSQDFNSISSYGQLPAYDHNMAGLHNYDSRVNPAQGRLEEEIERRAFTHETFGEQQNARSLPISQIQATFQRQRDQGPNYAFSSQGQYRSQG